MRNSYQSLNHIRTKATDLDLRQYECSDFELLFKIYQDSWKTWLEKRYDWNEAWQRENLLSQLDFSRLQLVERGQHVVGYVQFSICLESITIEHLSIHPNFQGTGIGSAVLEILRSFRSVKREYVFVLYSNPKAIFFYKKNGFYKLQLLDHYYQMIRL